MREDLIYNWMHDNADKCGYVSNPFGFVSLLTENAKCYVNFAKGKDAKGNDNAYLKNIIYLGGKCFSTASDFTSYRSKPPSGYV